MKSAKKIDAIQLADNKVIKTKAFHPSCANVTVYQGASGTRSSRRDVPDWFNDVAMLRHSITNISYTNNNAHLQCGNWIGATVARWKR